MDEEEFETMDENEKINYEEMQQNVSHVHRLQKIREKKNCLLEACKYLPEFEQQKQNWINISRSGYNRLKIVECECTC